MKKRTHEIVLQALIAAVYVAVTFALQSVSFMPVQFRLSEILLILVLFNPKHALGLTVGTIIANSFSTVSVIDIVVGSFATYVSLMLMIHLKNKHMKYLAPSVINGLIVGIMLSIVLGMPVFYSIGSVFVSEFVVTYIPWFIIGNKLLNNEGMRRIFG